MLSFDVFCFFLFRVLSQTVVAVVLCFRFQRIQCYAHTKCIVLVANYTAVVFFCIASCLIAMQMDYFCSIANSVSGYARAHTHARHEFKS